MSHDKSLFDLQRHPLKMRKLRVVRVTDLTPHMRRITLGGDDLAGFTSLAPEDHVKLFFPREGEREPVLPTLGPLGLVLPTFGSKPIARDYTPLRYDAEARELDVDFFLHGGGVASTWAARAAVGQPLGVAGPRGSYVLKREFDWQLFVGDETALPEMIHRIETLPEKTHAFLVGLVLGTEEELPVKPTGALHARGVRRATPGADAGAPLVAAVNELPRPGGEGFAWVAGEASEVRAVYRHLLHERNMPRSHVHTSGHWKRGVVAHDHHEPIEAGSK